MVARKGRCGVAPFHNRTTSVLQQGPITQHLLLPQPIGTRMQPCSHAMGAYCRWYPARRSMSSDTDKPSIRPSPANNSAKEKAVASTSTPLAGGKEATNGHKVGVDSTTVPTVTSNEAPVKQVDSGGNSMADDNAASNTKQTVAGNIGSTFTFAEHKYAELESLIMDRLHESNRRRFRVILLSSLLAIVWIGVVFGDQIRHRMTEQTAEIAAETLQNETLKVQTQELAMAVVQTVLNDKDITAHAATFLREASTAPETQQALLQLTVHILQHKDTLEELKILSQKLIADLAEDKVILTVHEIL